jgi:hypothetical protein
VTKRRLRAAALDRIFEQALLVGSATLLSGCCGPLSRLAPAYTGIVAVEISGARDPRLQQLAREGYSEGLDAELCERHCGMDGIQGCSFAKLAVPQPAPLPEVRCEYGSGAAELRSLPPAAAGAGARTPDCSYVCAYPDREVTSCSLVAAVTETDVLLCRFYEPARCVTHIPSGRPPACLKLDDLPALTTARRYWAVAAYLEAASARAFDDLAWQLRRHHAPSALVERCRRAARDERFHQRALGELAGGDLVGLGAASLPAHAEPSLCELALHNVAEGCVIETYSALVMAYQARHAASPRLRTLLRRVARDERRHALLSWDILAWSLRRLAAHEREQLGHELGRARARLETMLPQLSSELSTELGLPDVRVAKSMLRSLDARLWHDGAGAGLSHAQAAAVA